MWRAPRSYPAMLVGANRPRDRAAASWRVRPRALRASLNTSPAISENGLTTPKLPSAAEASTVLVPGSAGARRHRRIFPTASAGSNFTTTRSAVYSSGPTFEGLVGQVAAYPGQEERSLDPELAAPARVAS